MNPAGAGRGGSGSWPALGDEPSGDGGIEEILQAGAQLGDTPGRVYQVTSQLIIRVISWYNDACLNSLW